MCSAAPGKRELEVSCFLNLLNISPTSLKGKSVSNWASSTNVISMKGLTKIHLILAQIKIKNNKARTKDFNLFFQLENHPQRPKTFPTFCDFLKKASNLHLYKQQTNVWLLEGNISTFQQHSLLTQAANGFSTIWDLQSSHYWVKQFTEYPSAWVNPSNATHHWAEELKLLLQQKGGPSILHDLKHGPVEKGIHEGDWIQGGKCLCGKEKSWKHRWGLEGT